MLNGIVESMGWDEYLAHPGVNPSSLVHGLKSMKHFHAAWTAEQNTPTTYMDLGSITHTLIMEPDEFEERYAIYSGATRRGKEWDKFVWANEGKQVVRAQEVESAQPMVEAVRNDPIAMELVNATKHEVSIFVEDHDVICKGRPDCLGQVLVDLKSTNDVEKHKFGRVFGNLHYASKLACYKRWAELAGNPVSAVFVITFESKPPYDVAVVEVPDVLLENAWPRIEKVLKRIPECQRTNIWPGVAEGGLYDLVVPNWSMDEEEILDWSE